MFSVELEPGAIRQFRRLDPPMARRIESAMRSLGDTQESGKPLHAPLAGRRSLRVGEYRIIYKVYPSERRVAVLRIAHRREVYR